MLVLLLAHVDECLGESYTREFRLLQTALPRRTIFGTDLLGWENASA